MSMYGGFMEMILNGAAEAKNYSKKAFDELVGNRFRFEPLPNQLSQKLEEAHLAGELHGAKKLLKHIETYFEAEDLLEDLRPYIMSLSNHLHQECEDGEPLTGASVFNERPKESNLTLMH